MSTNFFHELLYRSWWVIAFALICLIFYEQGLKKRHADYILLSENLQNLEKKKEVAIAKQIDLQTAINSQSDPAWVELILMKGLGLVPEGQQKVFFPTE